MNASLPSRSLDVGEVKKNNNNNNDLGNDSQGLISY